MDNLHLILAALVLGPGTVFAIPEPSLTKSPVAATSTGASTPSTVPAYEQYSYYGERYRDPFIPLVGQVTSDTLGDHAPQTATLALKGIIQDAQGRMALLASGVSSYILKGGRLYDGHNKMVKGISGVIKKESVVVVGADRAVRELKVKVAL